MTLDDLAVLATEVEVAEEARQSKFGMRDRYQIRRAGVRAVVLALRDEMGQSLAEAARQECCGDGAYDNRTC